MTTIARTISQPCNISLHKEKTQPMLAFNRQGKIDVFLFDDTELFITKMQIDKSNLIPLTDWTKANILYQISQQINLTPGSSQEDDADIKHYLLGVLSDNITNKEEVVNEICEAWNKVAKQPISTTYAQFKPSNLKTPLEYQGAYVLTLHDYFSGLLSTLVLSNIDTSLYLQIAELINSTLEGRAYSKNPYLQTASLTALGETCANDITTFKSTFTAMRNLLHRNNAEWFTTITGMVEIEIDDLLTDEKAQANLPELRKVLSDLLNRNVNNLASCKFANYLEQTIPLMQSPLTHPVYAKLAKTPKDEKPTAEQILFAIEYCIEKILREKRFVLESITTVNPHAMMRLVDSNVKANKTELLSFLLDKNQSLTPVLLKAIAAKSRDAKIQDTAKDLLAKVNPEKSNPAANDSSSSALTNITPGITTQFKAYKEEKTTLHHSEDELESCELTSDDEPGDFYLLVTSTRSKDAETLLNRMLNDPSLTKTELNLALKYSADEIIQSIATSKLEDLEGNAIKRQKLS